MNIEKAYRGAVYGLRPTCQNFHVRDIQIAIATEITLQRPRGGITDGQTVTDADLAGLKDRGEKRLK